jgi:hypothetical protein
MPDRPERAAERMWGPVRDSLRVAHHTTAIGENIKPRGGEVSLSDSRLSMALGITPNLGRRDRSRIARMARRVHHGRHKHLRLGPMLCIVDVFPIAGQVGLRPADELRVQRVGRVRRDCP